jgi:predicted NBD/HSP70 family sugar kinase
VERTLFWNVCGRPYTLIYMYLGIDVGATKTLFAVFDKDGEMVCEKKIKTNHDYEQFKSDLAEEILELCEFKPTHCCIAFPGRLDHENGIGERFGNLPWVNVPLLKDMQTIMTNMKVLIHNDAKLAGLSEAILLHKKYRKVLYITLSTGIGGGVIVGEKIPPEFAVFEPGGMMFDHNGKQERWESFASGKALKEKYGKIAAEINDPEIWKEYSKDLVLGFEDVLATTQPDVVVIGGGVGAHFEKFKPYLEAELKKINNPLVPVPPLLKAQRPEEAVIYGCYDYIVQNL